MRLSIRLRLTLWFSIVMAAALTMFGLGVLSLHARWGHAQFDAELADTAGALVKNHAGGTGRKREPPAGRPGNATLDGGAGARNRNSRCSRTAHRRALERFVDGRQRLPHRYGRTTIVQNAESRPRRLARADTVRVVSRRRLRDPGRRAFGSGRTQHRLLARVLQVATPLIVLMTAGLSWWVASSALRPITILAGEAGEITARSTDWRLDVPSSADEVGQLARAFNQLLERLGQSLRMQRSFMADASHELRTPVSVIKTAAEVTLGRETGRKESIGRR